MKCAPVNMRSEKRSKNSKYNVENVVVFFYSILMAFLFCAQAGLSIKNYFKRDVNYHKYGLHDN